MSGLEIAIVLVAMMVAWTVKAVTGMGGPILVVPIASLFIDVETAVAVVAFPNLLSNLLLATRERESISDTRDLPALAGFGVIGAIGGAFVFVYAPEDPLVILLISALTIYVITFFAKPDLRVGPDLSRRLAPGVGFIGGGFQGAIGISGPIIGSWIHSYRLPRNAHVLSVTSLFFITGTAQLIVIAANGKLAGLVPVTLASCLPVLISIPIGTRLRDRLNTKSFDLAVVALLCVSIVALTVRTVT